MIDVTCHRLGPNPSLVSEDHCSSVLQTTCQPLQSFHRDLYCSGSVEGCLHSPSIQSRFPPLSCLFPTHIHYAGFIKNLGKNSCKTFSLPLLYLPIVPHTHLKFQRSVCLPTHRLHNSCADFYFVHGHMDTYHTPIGSCHSAGQRAPQYPSE